MKKLSWTVLILAFAIPGGARADEPVTQAKIAEQACHRVERLVILKKIDDSFLSRFRDLTVERLAPAQPGEASYRVIVEQYPSSGGTSSLELLMDDTGKTLKATPTMASGTPGPAPTWPDKDPVTLAENSLHFILEQNAAHPDIVPYFTGLTKLVLSQQGTGASTLAISEISTAAPGTLVESLKVSGEFVSYQLRSR